MARNSAFWFSATLVGIVCSGLIVCEDFYLLKHSRDLSLKELMAELDKPMEAIDHGKKYPESVGMQVVHLLAKTRHKGRRKAILNQFSINDLLALNKVEKTNCFKPALEKRRNICAKMVEHENLSKYCEKTMINLNDWCKFKIIDLLADQLKAMGAHETAERFRVRVQMEVIKRVDKEKRARKKRKNKEAIAKEKAAGADEKVIIDYEAAVNSVYKSRGMEYEKMIKSICEVLIDNMGGKYDISIDVDSINYEKMSWLSFYQYCLIQSRPRRQHQADHEDSAEDMSDLDLDSDLED